MSTEKTESTFLLRYAVRARLRCAPEAAWAKLTNAAAFPEWNSTVTRIDGEIALGNKLAIRVPIAPDRAFTPRVVALEPARRMVWRDGFAPMFLGTRTFTLAPDGDATAFEMLEEFRGLMLPLIKRSLPDFRPVFDQYAADLARACAATN
jgi:hypothetical protein